MRAAPATYRVTLAMYQAGILPVDKLQTHTLKLERINAGFDRLARAQAVRQIIDFMN